VLMAVDKAALAKQLQRAEQECAGLQTEVRGGTLGMCGECGVVGHTQHWLQQLECACRSLSC
jgi:hypothetical protein